MRRAAWQILHAMQFILMYMLMLCSFVWNNQKYDFKGKSSCVKLFQTQYLADRFKIKIILITILSLF